MRLTLLTLFTVLHVASAATSLKLQKHATDTAAYISHLSRRGIIPSPPQRRVHVYPRRSNAEKKPRRRLVKSFHPEYDLRSGPIRRSAADYSSSEPVVSQSSSVYSRLASSSGPSPSPESSTSSASDTSSSVSVAAALGSSSSHSSASTALGSSYSDSSASTSSASLPASSSQVSSVSASSSAKGSSRAQSSETSSSASAPYPSGSSVVYDLDNVQGVAYTIDALIGEEKTPVPVLVDTGSAQFWVAAKQCDLCSASHMTTSIDMGSTCPNSTTTLTYGIGTASGCPVQTSLDIGGLSLTNYTMLGVTEIDSGTSGLGWVYSGMWGIASAALSSLGSTPVDQLYSEGKIAAPEVGFYFIREEDVGDSRVIIGDVTNFGNETIPIDQSRVAKLSRDSSDQGHYMVTLDKLAAFGAEIYDFDGQKVILDTGSTMLAVPPSMWKPLYGTLGNGTTIELSQPDKPQPIPEDEKIYVLPCDMLFPDQTALTFTFGGVDFGMQWRDFIGSELDDVPGYCYPSVISLGEDLILLGGTFLVNVYHAVDTESGQVTMYGLD